MNKNIHFIILLLILSQFAIGQNLKKAFNSLDDKNYTSARIIFSEALKSPDSKAIGDFGMAVVYKSTSLRIEDMYRAYESIMNSKREFRSCSDKLKKKYKSRINPDIIEKERKLIDNALFTMVKKEDEVKSYQKHIDICVDSEFKKESIDLRNAKAYSVAVGFNTIKSYSDFCEKYPDSKEYTEAQIIMTTMAWDECVIYNTIAKYQDFIEKYPNASQLTVAKDKIRKLEYNKAIDINTQVAFDGFIAKYPNSEEAISLQGKGVKTAYENVEKFKSQSVCENFLSDYPNSEYSARVTIIRDSLAYEAVLEKNTPEDFNAFIETYPNAIQVPLVMDKMGKLLYSKEELQIKRAKYAIRHQQIINSSVYSFSDTIHVLQEMKYDVFGNCIYDFEQILSDYSELDKFYYDDAGDMLLKKEFYVNNKIKTVTEYSYDLKGLTTIASTNCYFNCLDSATTYVDSFVYDANRNLLSIKTYADTNKLIESHVYTYDNKGNRFKEEFKRIAADSYKIYNITMNYNGKGYLIQKAVENEQGETTKVESFSYDGLDKVISSSRYDARGTQMITFYYNEQGLVDHEVITYEEDESKNSNRSWKYEIRKSKDEVKQ